MQPLGERGGGGGGGGVVEQMTESLCSNTLWKIIFIEAERIRSGSVNLLAISEWKIVSTAIYITVCNTFTNRLL